METNRTYAETQYFAARGEVAKAARELVASIERGDHVNRLGDHINECGRWHRYARYWQNAMDSPPPGPSDPPDPLTLRRAG